MSREEDYWDKFFAWKRGEIKDPPRPPPEMGAKKKPPRKKPPPAEFVPPEKKPPKVRKVKDLDDILGPFLSLPLEEKEDRRLELIANLVLSEQVKEDPDLKEDIGYYQSYIVNTALRMLTRDDVPKWVTTEALKRLQTQIQRVFEPSVNPIESGLRYKNEEKLAKMLEVPLKDLLEEYVKEYVLFPIFPDVEFGDVFIVGEDVTKPPKPAKKK